MNFFDILKDKKISLIEIIAVFVQILTFYVLPLFSGPTDAMGLVLIIMFVTLVNSIVIGIVQKKMSKFLYPIFISILFLPSVFIYYNSSALIHSIWYLIISYIGITIGSVGAKAVKALFKI